MPDKKDGTWESSITVLAPSESDDVRTLYNGFSTEYNSAVESWGYSAPERVADYLFKHVELDAKVLDAGCGTGLTGAALSSKGFSNITGSDLSPDSIELARKAGHYQNLHVLNLSEKLPFENGTYDGIICVGVFSYIPELEPVLKELLRVLAPGGTFVFTQREDLFKQYENAKMFDQLRADVHFERVLETAPQPYLPGNPSFADNIGVHYFIWQKHL